MSNFGFKRSRFPAFGFKNWLCCLVVTFGSNCDGLGLAGRGGA